MPCCAYSSNHFLEYNDNFNSMKCTDYDNDNKEGREGVFGTAAEVSWSPLPLTLHSLQSPTLMTITNTTFTTTTTDPSQ